MGSEQNEETKQTATVNSSRQPYPEYKTWKIMKRQLSFLDLHRKIDLEMEQMGKYGLGRAVVCPEMNSDSPDDMQKAMEYHIDYLNFLVSDPNLCNSPNLLEF